MRIWSNSRCKTTPRKGGSYPHAADAQRATSAQIPALIWFSTEPRARAAAPEPFHFFLTVPQSPAARSLPLFHFRLPATIKKNRKQKRQTRNRRGQQLSALPAQNCSASPSEMGRPETGSRNVIKRLTQSRMISCRQVFCVPPLRKATGVTTNINPAAATIDRNFMVQCHYVKLMNLCSGTLMQ